MMLSLRRKVAFAVAITLAAVLLVELGAQAIEWSRPPYWSERHYLDSPVYRDCAWFGHDFMLAKSTQPAGWATLDGTHLLFPRDYQDNFFTIARGLRATPVGLGCSVGPGAPRLWAIGGSTTYCSEVPDGLTWPTRLQAAYTSNTHQVVVRVQNMGVVGATLRQEVERLTYEFATAQAPAMLVGLDGVNDIIQGVFNGHPFLTLMEEERMLPPHGVLRVSALARLLKPDAAEVPPHVADPLQLQRMVDAAVEEYVSNCLAIDGLCKLHATKYFACLQPCLYTLARPLSVYEQRLVAESPPGMARCFAVGYKALRAAQARLREKGVAAFDLSDIMDAVPDSVYLDFCHVGPQGNERIAEAVRGCIQMR